MKLISWNVNGIRACIGKGFEESFAALDADIFCLQETKCQQGQVKLELPGYYQYWNYANRRGYSGTAVFTKKEPLSVAYGIGIEEHDKEGRVITLEDEKFYLEMKSSRFEFLQDCIDDDKFISDSKRFIKECQKYYDYKKKRK